MYELCDVGAISFKEYWEFLKYGHSKHFKLMK